LYSHLISKVRIRIYTQAFLALLCLTFSLRKNSQARASGATFIAIAITSLLFLFGPPNGGNLGQLRGPRIVEYSLSLYGDSEEHRFAPLPYDTGEKKQEADPLLKANKVYCRHFVDPVHHFDVSGIIAEFVLFGVCVLSKLCGSGVVRAAQLCVSKPLR
jgi:hypothetical protein